MPSYLSSSRISKPTSNSLRRHSSSPFSATARVKPSPQRAKSLAEAYEDAENEDEKRLDATGLPLSVLPDPAVVDVLSAVRHAAESLFCPIPERAGMNSVRIAEVLNFQKNLPPLVSLAHVHALISASSKTEKEINNRIANGDIRRIQVIGRGNDISGASDFLITTTSLRNLLNTSHIPEPITNSFLALLAAHPRATTLSPTHLPPTHLTALIKAGFLVSSSSVTRNLTLSGSSIVSPTSISRAHSGTSGAVGGDAAFENLGGVSSSSHRSSSNSSQQQPPQPPQPRRAPSSSSSSSSSPSNRTTDLHLSLPNIGAFIRLLAAGRAHLLSLLAKSAYRELPLYLLRERWDGDGGEVVRAPARARSAQGGVFFAGEVFPDKTKKWRKLWGMRFEWALAECLGAGEVEVFETGSVGLGVRVVG